MEENNVGINYLKKAATAVGSPPQSQPLDIRQTANNAGGFVYAVDDWARLDRFLILGSEGGTYYCREQDLTKANIDCVKRCVAADGVRTVNRIVEISEDGRAPKNDPALLALAYAASKGDNATRAAAFLALPKVARIGTHLYHFITFARKFRGMGRGIKTAIRNWYLDKTPERFAEQAVKYQQRDGWSHRDLLRLVRPKFTGQHQNIAKWIVKGKISSSAHIPEVLEGHILIQETDDEKKAAKLIRKYGLVRESVPTQLLNSKVVWEALLEDMPLTAMIRNLGNMSKNGLLVPMSDASKNVAARLMDAVALRKSRVHPIQILVASAVYGTGHGMRGSGTWTVDPKIFSALNEAFYGAFKNVEPTGKRFYIGVDVSGSMSSGGIAGTQLTPRAGACAMALLTARTEENYYIAGFQQSLVKLPFTNKTTLDSAIKHTDGLPFGSTDCAAPMLDALRQGIPADVFMVITDNETWSGGTHPMVALQNYRNKTGINSKLIVVGMTATEFTIADPTDAGTLDVVGFDASVPELIAGFVR